jgi:hypothetical protein
VPNNVKVESTKTKLPRNLPEKQNHNPKTKTTATNSLKPTIEKQNKGHIRFLTGIKIIIIIDQNKLLLSFYI